MWFILGISFGIGVYGYYKWYKYKSIPVVVPQNFPIYQKIRKFPVCRLCGCGELQKNYVHLECHTFDFNKRYKLIMRKLKRIENKNSCGSNSN